MKKGQVMSEKKRKHLSRTIKNKYKNGYTNPMKGKKRPDLSEYNRKHKSEQTKEWFNNKKNQEKIEKRNRKISKTRLENPYNLKGPNNHNWKGGLSYEPYPYEFNKELKLAVKIRDRWNCKICKTKHKDTPQGLHVHHIDYDKTNNDLNNLVALCHKCHTKTNGNRQKWIEYFSRQFKIKKTYYSWKEITEQCRKVASFLSKKQIQNIVPIPRGGIIPAIIISNILKKPLENKVRNKNDIIVDEIVDFGITLKRYKKKYPKNLFICLHLNKKNFKLKQKPDFYVEKVDKFVVYPWEE